MSTDNETPRPLRRLLGPLALGAAMGAGAASAAPLPLAELPLFLGTTPEPNILLQVDDSGSMDWSILVPPPSDGSTIPTDGVVLGLDAESVTRDETTNATDGTPDYKYTYLFDNPGNTDGATVQNPATTTGNQDIPTILDEVFDPADANPNYRRPKVSCTNYRAKNPVVSADPTGSGITGGFGYWRLWNRNFNPINYNPEVRYAPWEGFDSAGNTFTDASIDGTGGGIRLNPYNPSTASANRYRIDVFQRLRTQLSYLCGTDSTIRYKKLTLSNTATPPASRSAAGLDGTDTASNNFHQTESLWLYPARYYAWDDSRKMQAGSFTACDPAAVTPDGRVDADDCHQLVEIRPEGDAGCSYGASCPTTFNRGPGRNECAGGVCSRTQELQNYANWHQYYSRRILTAKGAFGTVVRRASPTTRWGLVTLHNNSNADNSNTPSNTAIRVMTLDPTSGSTKRSLMDGIYRMDASGGTPLQAQMNNAMRYLECTNTANTYGFTHSAANDGSDSDGDGVNELDTLASGCPHFTAVRGGECQQNFLIHMTDGFYNAPPTNIVTETSGGTANIARGSFNADNDGDSPNTAGNTVHDAKAYGDSFSGTLADIAMFWYERDIQPTLTNNLPVVQGIDDNRAQHVVTYTVSFGLDGTVKPNTASPANKATGPDGMPLDKAAAFAWPDPQPGSTTRLATKIDDLRHAAFNGRGKYLSARDPASMIAALDDAINSIDERTSAASSVALNSGSLNTGTSVFQAKFNTGDWTGQLISFPISAGPGLTVGCGSEDVGELCAQAWDAGEVIKTQNWDSGREIITMATAARTGGIPFRWTSLDTAEKDFLKFNPASLTLDSDTVGENRVKYLRGDQSLEGDLSTDFRERSSPLGDLINSDPFFIGPPQAPFEGLTTIEAGYSDFRTTHQNRTPVVWVGGNDGMMHGFRASDGRELLAFVPGERGIYEDLSRLTNQIYNGGHRFFVDGSPAVGDAFFSGSWRTVLVSGMRAGGQGLFALDVTDPSGFDETNASSLVRWQFTDQDDADLGYTYSRPTIARMQNGKWAAIVGNGYNSSRTTFGSRNLTDPNVGTGEACLFIIFLEGPGDNVWASGTEYKKICVTSGGPSNATSPNGLSAPGAVDKDGDFVIDVIYAGDLEGNMWKFDVSSATVGSWNVALSGQPLFRACAGACTDTTRQPITVSPEVGAHPDGPPSTHGVLVYFGTGRYIVNGDNSPIGQDTQTFYMIWDTPATQPGLPLQRSALVSQSITDEFIRNADGTKGACDANNKSGCLRTVSANTLNLALPGSSPELGCFLDFVEPSTGNNRGERMVSDPQLRQNRIVFTTLLPSQSRCEFGGTGFLMELSLKCGALGSPIFDVNNDGVIDQNDAIAGEYPAGLGSEQGIIPKPTILALLPGTGDGGGPGGIPGAPCTEFKYMSGSAGGVMRVQEACDYRVGRLNWRQIR